MALCNSLKCAWRNNSFGYGNCVKHYTCINSINFDIDCKHTENVFICTLSKRCASQHPKPMLPRGSSFVELAKEKFWHLKSIQRAKRNRCCYYTYENMINQIPIEEFFKEFGMPDTYASFFTVVELHVYMLSARLMQDRNHGLILRNEIIEAMWNDTHVRIDYLDEIIAEKTKYKNVLSSQFQAALIGYDEGVQGSDAELAAVLWRRFFAFDCEDIEKLERLVKYVRLQLDVLCSLPVSDIIYEQKLSWFPLKNVQIDRIA